MQPSTAAPRILIVEDDDAIRELMGHILSRNLGAQVVSAADGQEGLDLFRSGNIALIVTDIRMPRMSGTEMLREIRKEDGKTPAIVFSGCEIRSEEAKGLGQFSFLPKIEFPRLAEVAGELLRRQTEATSDGGNPLRDRAA